MLGGTPLQSVLGAGVDNTDHEAMRAWIREACKIGLSVLLVWPESKVPADVRTSRQLTAARKKAREEARLAGRKDWERVEPASGLALATSDANVILKKDTGYLDLYIKQFADQYPDGKVPVNVAVEIGGTNLLIEPGKTKAEDVRRRVVVVDCDTPEQMALFREKSEVSDAVPPTVLTPGQLKDGVMAHSDGGHWWFYVPDDVVLPDNIGALTWSGPGGFTALWDRRYVLVPPSTRPEGAYEQPEAGREYHIPEWLADEIVKAGEQRAFAAARAAEGFEDSDLTELIDQWAESTPWSHVLEPLGWSRTPRTDKCGCDVWTAPGIHASPKSATAHDSGCQLDRYTAVNAPLHIWTDHPGEPFDSYIAEHRTSTISKLQAVAYAEFGGSMGKAMDTLGLMPEPETMPGVKPSNLATEGVDQANLSQSLDMPDAPTVLDRMTPAQRDAAEAHMAGAITRAEMVGAQQVCCCGILINAAMENVMADDDGQLWHLPSDGGDAHRADGTDGADTDESAAAALADPPQGDLFDSAGEEPAAPKPAPSDDGSPFPDEVDEPSDPLVLNSTTLGVPVIAPFAHWRDMPPPEYIIDGLMEHGGMSCLIGPPGVGKSSVALDMGCHIATGRAWQGLTTYKTKVLYMPGEGLRGAVQRIASWEEAHGVEVGDELILSNEIIKLASHVDAWREVANYVIRLGIGFIIFDTFARMATDIEENSATEVGRAIERLDQMRRATNAGVLIVHHTGKHSESARGSSALNGAIDSELLVRLARWDTDQALDANGRLPGKAIELDTTKQKNAEQLEEPIPLFMVNWEPRSAPLITGTTGTVDPLSGNVAVLARPVPEAAVETAVRVYRYAAGFTQQGVTRADIVRDLKMDAYTAGRTDAPKHWRRKVAEAVDKALRYDLLVTLTGTPAGQRYIPSPTGTVEAARLMAAAEAITDQSGNSD